MANKAIVDKAISDLTQATQITDEDLFVLEQNSEAKKLPGSILKNYIADIELNYIEKVSFDAQDRCVIKLSDGTIITSAPLKGEDGYTPTASVTKDGKTVTITITDETGTTSETVSDGTDAPTITKIAIDENYHLIITMSNGTSYDAGYCRGASGAGTGDMIASIYDPQGKAQDIFAYADAKSNKAVAFTVTLSASGWSGKAQTVSDARFLTGNYAYSVAPDSGSFAAYGESVIYADNVTTAGQIQFHCGEVPTADLTVNILRMEAIA